MYSLLKKVEKYSLRQWFSTFFLICDTFFKNLFLVAHFSDTISLLTENIFNDERVCSFFKFKSHNYLETHRKILAIHKCVATPWLLRTAGLGTSLYSTHFEMIVPFGKMIFEVSASSTSKKIPSRSNFSSR